MKLTPEQKAAGWIEWSGGECPIKDRRTVAEIKWSDGSTTTSSDWADHDLWINTARFNILAYRIIEAHGADAEPARPTPMFDLQQSHDHPGEAHWKAERVLYNVIDMPGLLRGQIALTPDERHAIGGTIFAVSAQDARSTPFPASYDDLVFDADGWSQTIIVDGKRPEWLRDDDGVRRFGEGLVWDGKDEIPDDLLAIRVRRREPKRETVECWVNPADLLPRAFQPFNATIDLIDGKPDLSTLKIAEDAL